ncbi:hypothetical protein Goshw_005992 [Gossypium schwendimanii]|uniref:Phytocyanin domain-containing protein n=1 Tax=Gossypium schwendimanii TaxID=34291 RepID=A0A7J9NDV5_GOSSC|nr:hypothetical protein [Gossypium schwendimanii]
MTMVTKMVMVLVFMAASTGVKWVGAQVHHVVGGDRGWDPSFDVASWSSGRIFRVGDKICFPYSAAQEGIVQVKSKDEYESCDVGNPIRMYTVGLDGIELDGEGIRYFMSSKPESCKKGLKLHVELMPLQSPEFPQETLSESESESDNSDWSTAAAPTTPSPSVQLYGNFLLLSFGLLLCTCMAI